MARIRSVKPEFWTDEKTGQLSIQAKCLFLGLLNLSDDYGVVEYRPVEWRAKLFPYDSHTTPVVLQTLLVDEILPAGLCRLFAMTDDAGATRRFLFVTNFAKHQVVNKPSRPILDTWENGDTPETYSNRLGIDFAEVGHDTTAPAREHSRSTPVALPPGREGKGEEMEGNTPSRRSGDPPQKQNGKSAHAFTHGVVKLTAVDLTKWEAAFPNIAVRAELMAMEPWLAQQRSWFNAAAGALAKRERESKRGPPTEERWEADPLGNRVKVGA
jgi:hypothetical protein